MLNIFSFLRWGWLLTIALFIPISLPVGGAQIKSEEVLESYYSPYFVTAGSLCEFRSEPYPTSNILRKVPLGTPMQILREWESSKGDSWFYVKITSLPLLEVNDSVKRGWIRI